MGKAKRKMATKSEKNCDLVNGLCTVLTAVLHKLYMYINKQTWYVTCNTTEENNVKTKREV